MIAKKIVEQARNTDVVVFFEKYRNMTFTHRGEVFRCSQHPSFVIKNDRLSWYWHSKGIGGHGILDFLIKVEKSSFPEAVKLVSGIVTTPAKVVSEAVHHTILILPEKARTPSRLYNHLCRKRKICVEIVDALIREGKIYEDRCGNVVFVGYDEYKTPRFASLHGTSGYRRFRIDCSGSDKRYSFNMSFPYSDQLYIFESAIDAMSHASIDILLMGSNAWKRCCRLSLSGTSDIALQFFLNKHPAIKRLVLCLDNDQSGHDASLTIQKKFSDSGYFVSIETPLNNDVNDDLSAFVNNYY